ncbi:hypothetical protein IWW37_000413 [Coemansia sp. RSA 2050]|nr:hypothetical protein IWW37_000413 [Coemansia sp. RSA 2050]KAJ2734186.1 hypothetical protein IW152_002525 [Coemansia sp. BCRC 34962]
MNTSRNKVDLSNLTPEQRKNPMQLKYGRNAGKSILGGKRFERKYFDSGDYALSQAGKTVEAVGQQHPSPESIPHQQVAAAQVPPLAGSPSSIGGLPIVSNIGIGVGAVGTMVNPSGLSPPAAHHISTVADARSPTTTTEPSTSGKQQPAVAGEQQPEVAAPAAVDSANLEASNPTAPAARPLLARRQSQLPSGTQYRLKD